MDKPFLTIDEQIDLLRSRGVSDSDGERQALMRDGYYAIVNGYKRPFIDEMESKAAGEDRYRDGTEFQDLYGLFSFDRALRSLTFSQLIKAEATARTAIAYTFARFHGETDGYLLQENYCTEDEFRGYESGGKSYAEEISGLTSILKRARDKSDSGPIEHYRARYRSVPIWVLCNVLTFGNMQHFFNLMKPGEKEAVCAMVAQSTGRLGDKFLGYFSVEQAKVSLEVLVKFRNICAHDERLYCASVGARKNVGFSKMIWMLERYLSAPEFYGYISEVANLFGEYASDSKTGHHLTNEMGFPEMLERMQARIPLVEQGDA